MTDTTHRALITADRLRSLLSYDPKNGLFVWISPTCARMKIGDLAGCLQQPGGYWKIYVDGRQYFAHRLAFLYMTGEWPKADVDHINGDRADNRWINLREATRSQNCGNVRRHCDSRTGFKGVTQARGKFQAKITLAGRSVYLGVYATAEAAHAAYVNAANDAFGTFARAG